MQAGTNVTVDANAAHPSDIRPSDPRHLNNLSKNMTVINSQVSADTKYDPQAPPRVDKNGKPVKESFMSELGASDQKLRDEKLYAVGAIAAIVGVTILVVLSDPKMRAPVATIRNGYLFLGSSLLLCLITIGTVAYARRQNEIITWYPQLAPL